MYAFIFPVLEKFIFILFYIILFYFILSFPPPVFQEFIQAYVCIYFCSILRRLFLFYFILHHFILFCFIFPVFEEYILFLFFYLFSISGGFFYYYYFPSISGVYFLFYFMLFHLIFLGIWGVYLCVVVFFYFLNFYSSSISGVYLFIYLFVPAAARHHEPSNGADGVSRARAGGVFPRRGGACQTQLHQNGDPEGGARAAGEQERVGAEFGPDGECVCVCLL